MKSFRSVTLFWLLALISVVLMTSCTRVQVKLGWKVYLERIPVSSVAVNLPGGGISPGEKLPLVVTVTQPDGKVLFTQGKGGGKVLWSDLVVTSTVVTVKKNGTISLPRDPRLSDGKTPHIVVTVPSHPDLCAELDIPLRYDRKYTAIFSGAEGASGSTGSNGADGSDGSPGSTDPENPSSGGNGSDGSDGSDGGNGGDGGDAPDVRVLVAFRPGDHPLLQIGVSNGKDDEEFYLVDPHGGSLTVLAEGGAGGSGGSGGSGGRGGSGGTGSPNGSSGSNGHDGHSGSRGRDGKDGRITVIYDPQAKPYLSVLHFANWRTYAPVFVERQVPPLW